MSRVMRNGIFKYMFERGFLYKGKTLTERTVRTMLDTGFFQTMVYDEVSGKRTVLMSEVERKVRDQKNERV